jgi:serine phosphatase RsbU (regulator of sigma subunit)
MTPSAENSDALNSALLKTERTRIIAVMLFLVVAYAYLAAQQFVFGIRGLPLFWMSLIIGVLLLVKGLLLSIVHRQIKQGGRLGNLLPLGGVSAEILAVTSLLLMATFVEYVGPYKALQTPINIAFCFFIAASVLRLNPLLCYVTGGFSALCYLGVAYFTAWRFPDQDAWEKTFAFDYYVTTAVLLVLGGGIAGYIAKQFQGYLRRALREADIRRQNELLEYDLSIARTVQRSLLPHSPPELQDFEIAGWNQSAQQTGGDYYDWQTLAGGRIAISFADVAGHGVGPALITAACRALSRVTYESVDTVGELLSRLNARIFSDLTADRFITYVAAILEPEKHRMALASAGHAPIFFYESESGQVETWEADDIPLGIIDGVEYPQGREIEFKAGDCLILVSDGLSDWRDESGASYGAERLRASIQRHVDRSAESMIEAIISDVEGFAHQTPQTDDVSTVIVKCTAR